MQNHRRLRCHQSTATEKLGRGSLVNLAILTNNGVYGLGEVDSGLFAISIKDDDDVTPIIATGIILQAEGHHPLGGIEEFKMLSDQMGVAQTEGRMMLAEGDEVLIILEHLLCTPFLLRSISSPESINGTP